MHFVLAVLAALSIGGGAQDIHHSFCYFHPHAYVCVHHDGFHHRHLVHRLHGRHH